MRKLLLIGCGVLLSLSAGAQTVKLDMQPGLWENSFKMTGASGEVLQTLQSDQMKAAMEEMKKQLANMPAEQREQMEAIMAQSGMKVNDDSISFQNDKVQVSTDGSKIKQCITKAEIDRGQLPQDDENCKSTLTQISKSRFKSTHICTGENPSRGESDIVFSSPKQYTGKGKMTQTVDGKTHTLEVELNGNWVSNDCGEIKPD